MVLFRYLKDWLNLIKAKKFSVSYENPVEILDNFAVTKRHFLTMAKFGLSRRYYQIGLVSLQNVCFCRSLRTFVTAFLTIVGARPK